MDRSPSSRRLALFCLGILLSTLPLSAATVTWTGTTSNLWSVAANWGGTAPVAGDDLVFPNGAANQSTSNDFPAGTSFNSISITGGTYTLAGNAITLGAGGLSVSVPSQQISLPITLGASQTWQTTVNTADFTDSGNVNLNGATLTLDVSSSFNTTVLSGVISGSGAIVKSAAGVVRFDGANTYTGTTTLNAGYLVAGNGTAAGVADGTPANGTIVNAGASFSVSNNVVLGNEWISATGFGQSGNGALQNSSCGNATYGGPIVLSGTVKISACGPGGFIVFNGVVSGSPTQIDVFGASPVTFNNAANSFSGLLNVQSGFPNTVNVGATNAVPAGVSVALGTGETLALNNFNDTIARLTGAGNVSLGSGTLTIAGTGSGTFSGALSGTGNVTLSGAQALTLSGPNTATGTLTDNGSSLVIAGATATWPGPVVLNTGSAVGLSSGATVGPLTVNSGAQVTPGGGGTATANTGNLAFAAGSVYHALIGGTSAGAFSRLNVTGSVTLGGATLSVSPTTTFPGGTQFLIIDNDGVDPVTGTFAGLAEGATFSAGGQSYSITYAGGTGNDVVLTAISSTTATTTTLNSSANPSTVGQPVTFTATISPVNAPPPTGTVTFFDGATNIGSTPVNSSGVATLTTSALTVGPHSITATYSGDANYTGSTSLPVAQVVNNAVVPALGPGSLLALLLALAVSGAIVLKR